MKYKGLLRRFDGHPNTLIIHWVCCRKLGSSIPVAKKKIIISLPLDLISSVRAIEWLTKPYISHQSVSGAELVRFWPFA